MKKYFFDGIIMDDGGIVDFSKTMGYGIPRNAFGTLNLE